MKRSLGRCPQHDKTACPATTPSFGSANCREEPRIAEKNSGNENNWLHTHAQPATHPALKKPTAVEREKLKRKKEAGCVRGCAGFRFNLLTVRRMHCRLRYLFDFAPLFADLDAGLNADSC